MFITLVICWHAQYPERWYYLCDIDTISSRVSPPRHRTNDPGNTAFHTLHRCVWYPNTGKMSHNRVYCRRILRTVCGPMNQQLRERYEYQINFYSWINKRWRKIESLHLKWQCFLVFFFSFLILSTADKRNSTIESLKECIF